MGPVGLVTSFLFASSEAAAANESGDTKKAKDIMAEWAAENTGSAVGAAAACARYSDDTGRFVNKPNHQKTHPQRLRAHVTRPTAKTIHARFMRLAGQKWLGTRMNSAWSISGSLNNKTCQPNRVHGHMRTKPKFDPQYTN